VLIITRILDFSVAISWRVWIKSMALVMMTLSWLGEKGLDRKSKAPFFMVSMECSRVAYPVITITTVSGCLALISVSTSIPESPGIMRSKRTISKWDCWIISKPSAPLSADCTSHPSSASIRVHASRILFSSSTTRTRGLNWTSWIIRRSEAGAPSADGFISLLFDSGI